MNMDYTFEKNEKELSCKDKAFPTIRLFIKCRSPLRGVLKNERRTDLELRCSVGNLDVPGLRYSLAAVLPGHNKDSERLGTGRPKFDGSRYCRDIFVTEYEFQTVEVDESCSTET